MSLRPQPIGSIPEQTARVAHAAFPKGHPYLTLRDHLGTIFQDEDFAALFPAWGYPGRPRGGWPSSRLCSSANSCPTARRPRRCERASIGSICEGWN